jgi:hypothetical protein
MFNRRLLVAATVLLVVFLYLMMHGGHVRAAAENGWTRIAEKGITNPDNVSAWPAYEHFGRLFFAAPPFKPLTGPAPLWAYGPDGFKKAAPDGFGNPNNTSMMPLAFYRNHLYCGTGNEVSGAELYRSNDGRRWERVIRNGFGDPNNTLCIPLGVQAGKLLVGFNNWDEGVKVFSYDGSRWTPANVPGFGDSSRRALATDISAGAVMDGKVHIIANGWLDSGPPNPEDVREHEEPAGGSGFFYPLVYRGGTTWEQFGPRNLNDPNNQLSHFIFEFDNKIYLGTENYVTGGQVWRYDGARWRKLGPDGIGDPRNNAVLPYMWGGNLYVSTAQIPGEGPGPSRAGNIYRQTAGGGFEKWVEDGFGDGGNIGLFMSGEYGGRLMVGTYNPNGFQVWAHEALSAAMPRSYYFAEGTTRDNAEDGTYQEWVTLQNPGDEDAEVELTYMLEDGSTEVRDYTVEASSRLTVDVQSDVGLDRDVSVKVKSDKSILAERPMYFNYRNKWTGGHVVMGVPEPSSLFYFAEGTTRDNPVDGTFEEWLCIQNPNDQDTRVEITYMLGTGETMTTEHVVQATSRKTVDVMLEIGKDRDVSVLLESDLPIVAERPMYFDYHGAWPGGHVTSGSRGPQGAQYFAEGCTREGFEEWLCIQNPGEKTAEVELTYQVSGEGEKTETVQVGPTTRHTVDVAGAVGLNKDVSVALSSDNPIIAERPMYFNYHGQWPGGHDVMGAANPASTIYFAEGTTRYNPVDGYFEEWICIQNPGEVKAEVDITFMKTDGEEVDYSITVDPNDRKTVNVNDVLGLDVDSAIRIVSDQPVVAERPMYFDYHGFATGGHDSTGYGI